MLGLMRMEDIINMVKMFDIKSILSLVNMVNIVFMVKWSQNLSNKSKQKLQ